MAVKRKSVGYISAVTVRKSDVAVSTTSRSAQTVDIGIRHLINDDHILSAETGCLGGVAHIVECVGIGVRGEHAVLCQQCGGHRHGLFRYCKLRRGSDASHLTVHRPVADALVGIDVDFSFVGLADGHIVGSRVYILEDGLQTHTAGVAGIGRCFEAVVTDLQ